MSSDRVRWKGSDGQIRDIAVCADPGPGTYQETADGMREVFRLAALKIRTATERLHDAPPGDIDGVSPERANFSAAQSEWQQARDNLAQYEAFIRVHPDMADALITVDCAHPRVAVDGLWSKTCAVDGAHGWYRVPTGKPAPLVEREAGADDDDEAPATAARRTA